MTNEQFLEILIDLYVEFGERWIEYKSSSELLIKNRNIYRGHTKREIADAYDHCRSAVAEKIMFLTENKETPNCGNDCAEWFMKQPLAKRLTDDEIKKLNDLMFLMRKMRAVGMMSTECIKNISNALYDIFGLEVFEEQRKYAIL